MRIVAEGVGSAPIACADEQLAALIRCSCGAQPLLEVLAAQLSLHGNAYVQIVKDGSGVPVDLFPLDGHLHLQGVRVETTDVAAYNALRTGVAS